MSYSKFLERKTLIDVPTGLSEFGKVTPRAWPLQRDQIYWGLRRGRAVFANDCGMGKTLLALEIARLIVEATGGNVLIVAPPCVAHQTIKEAVKFNVPIEFANRQENVKSKITITSYGLAHHFDPKFFISVLLDEGSILKSYNGATRTMLIEMFSCVPYRYVFTATPAPNDYMELGNYAEFLGVMSRTEMLATFFIHDGGETSKWRLKGHAEDPFWRWLSSWMMVIRKPSDLGYSDDGFVLPELNIHQELLSSGEPTPGFLFEMPAEGLAEQGKLKRATIEQRCDYALKLLRKMNGPCAIWCELNDEGDYLEYKLGKKCVQVAGKDDDFDKEQKLSAFLDRDVPYLVSKASIAGYGLNLQFCQNTIITNISNSYEQFYQLIRRFYRYGQKKPVNVHAIMTFGETTIWENIHRKQREADEMAENMVEHMKETMQANIKGVQREQMDYTPVKVKLPKWLKETA